MSSFSPAATRRFLTEWLLLGGISLLLGGLIAYSLVAEHAAIDARERQKLTAQANVIHDNIGRQLDAVNRALLGTRDQLPTWNATPDGMAQASKHLATLSDAMPGVRTLAILDRQGIVRASSRPELISSDFHQRDYFRVPHSNPDPKRLYVGPPFTTSLGIWGMNLVRITTDARGEFNGIVSATLDPEMFEILLQSVRYAPDMWVALSHGDGKIFLMAPNLKNAAGLDLARPDSPFRVDPDSGPQVSVDIGMALSTGDRRMIAQRTVQPPLLGMNKPLVVGVARQMDALYANWQRDAVIRGGLFALLAAIGALALHLSQRKRRQAEESAARTEAVLREKSAEIERFFAASLDLMCIAGVDGRFRKLNPTWETLLGYPLAELEQMRFFDFVHPDDLASTEAATARLADGDSVVKYANRFRCKDGSYRTIEWHSVPQGSLIYASARDITERQRMEAALLESKRAAEAANLAKSQFLANMSHEIRTPMNAVLGLLQLLQHTELTGRQQDYAQKAQTAAQSLLGVLNDILDFSKIEAGRLELEQAPFQLDALLRNLAVVLSPSTQNKPVEVLFDIAPDLPRALRGDDMRLQQVLLNLASNAIKFTKSGEVVIALRALSVDAGHTRIEFSVRDTGIGIAADKLGSIFEGFAQAEASTSRRYGGTGLGLAISQRLIRLMGGEIGVESTPGQGSRFHFTLDMARDRRADDAETQRQARDARTPLRVLIVDDNATAREVLRAMAETLGWQAEVLPGGNEAVTRISQIGNGSDSDSDSDSGCDSNSEPLRPYDVIFVDWKMPGMDGWETAQHIRELRHGKEAPLVIMVTAHGLELLAERMKSSEHLLDGVLIKPITSSMLFDAVADATGGNSVTARLASPADNASAASHPTGKRLAGLRLLVIEDNPTNQQVARELLVHEGAYVEVAGDGKQGIAGVIAAAPPFDALLMDIQMPEMDGFEATRILRQTMNIATPIIAMTANAMDSDRQACLAAGMNDHVGKPINLDQLVATLQRHCRRPAATANAPSEPGSALQNHAAALADEALPAEPAGFATREALTRLGGNRRLLADLARSFSKEQGGHAVRVRQQLRQGDLTTATREMHTLKGVAATLGAQALSRQAADLESAIKAGADNEVCDPLLDRLQALLDEAIAVLAQLADQFAPPTETHGGLPADAADLLAHLGELETLLAENNLRALDLYASLKQEFDGRGPGHLAALDEAMSQLDFSAAREKCRNLRQLLAA